MISSGRHVVWLREAMLFKVNSEYGGGAVPCGKGPGSLHHPVVLTNSSQIEISAAGPVEVSGKVV